MQISNPLKKFEKNYQRKSDRKIEFLTFYYWMQKFSAFNFFWKI